MALPAGEIAFTLEFAQGLKDSDWFGKQDPYAVVKIGNQTYRSRTHVDGGRNPVWNQTFTFNVINENTAEINVFDEDTTSRDDSIGMAAVSLAKARTQGADRLQVPVVVGKSRKQRGFISVSLKFTPNDSIRPQPQMQAAMPMPMAMPAQYQQPMYPMAYQQHQPAMAYHPAQQVMPGQRPVMAAPQQPQPYTQVPPQQPVYQQQQQQQQQQWAPSTAAAGYPTTTAAQQQQYPSVGYAQLAAPAVPVATFYPSVQGFA